MRQFFSRLGKVTIVIVIFLGFIALLTIRSFFEIVDAGEVGVVSTFGSVGNDPLQPGFHIKNPFAQVIKMNTRTDSYTMSASYAEGEIHGDDSIQALAKDGGLVWFDVTVLYRLDASKAPEVYRSLGLGYEENIIRPDIRSVIRGVASRYPVNDLYSTKREETQQAMFEELKKNLEPRGIIVEDVLLRNVNISDTLSNSIEQKLAAEQSVQREQFEIERAKKAAEKQKVEAEGQKNAQAIINESLTNKYLYYLYISELKTRAGTIYVPTNPDNGLPLFKGVED